MRPTLDSFGRIDRKKRDSLPFEALNLPIEDKPKLLAFGNGRSYGDSCHNDDGLLIAMCNHAKLISFDTDSGVFEAESGITLEEIIATAAPSGYFLAVTPGTKFVTLGGAIANDVHGKNHHLRGTFGCHVESFRLLRSDGQTYVCSSSENDALFRATIGGMGLTGIIVSARIRLMKIGSLDVIEKIQPFKNLDHYFDIAEANDAENEYAVAWLDQLASGDKAGRGVLITGNHADNGNFKVKPRGFLPSVPFEMPFSMLNRFSLKAFNYAYFKAKSSKTTPHLTDMDSFFYPLDGVKYWNRLYGHAGLFQHQSVIPFETARSAIAALLQAAGEAGQASFLTVLKRFGSIASPGILSFPRAGFTLTLDFPNKGLKTLQLLDRLDAITMDFGGRVNPYKDHHMSAACFKQGFEQWQTLETLRDPAFCSDFWSRTALAVQS
ncbi:FAD-binding oxidoreductase [Paenochrobactrum pullorum]|uniref:FAD-binding oxidoreductase n=1 Tax=Paenochrobactrum pullorum TaxID=1324351 RepID=UPI0035BBBA19